MNTPHQIPQDILEDLVVLTANTLNTEPGVVREAIDTMDDRNPIDVMDAMVELDACDISTLHAYFNGSEDAEFIDEWMAVG